LLFELRISPWQAARTLSPATTLRDAQPPSLEFVTFDARLADVARKEGFVLVDAAAA
jgi:hypothetical protein